MTKDLEETIAELGPGYKEVVDRLLDGCKVESISDRSVVLLPLHAKTSAIKRFAPLAGFLVAASLMIALTLAAVFGNKPHSTGDVETLSQEQPIRQSSYTLAYLGESGTEEIIRTQNPDGSWENDFMTRQNAAALRLKASTSVAYKKAMRYLRSRGLAPISDDELLSRKELAALNYRKK